MKKNNILIVHNYYQIPGGEDTVVENEKKMLEDHGHKVILYTRNNKELNDLSLIKKIILPLTTIFNPMTYKDIIKIIKEEEINIVHVHNTLNLISPSVYYAAVKCGIPVIQTIHNFRMLCPKASFYRDGCICEDCVEKGLGCAVKHKCYRDSRVQTIACVLNTLIHRRSGIYNRIYYICLTDFNKRKLLMLNRSGKRKIINPDHVKIKPNFVNDSFEYLPYERRKKRFVYAGRLDPLKGINILLDAWKLLGNDAPELVICGSGPMEEWCKEYIEKNHLSTVEMKGQMSNSDVRMIMGDSQGIILPTQWYEGFPMTIVEAFSMHVPVIGSEIGNVGEIIRDGRNGYVFRHDSAQDLADVIMKMMRNPIEIEQESIEAYSAERNYLILNEIYEDAVKEC